MRTDFREHVAKRAAFFAAIRRFFAERQVLEVDTPHLSHAASTDVHLHSFQVSNDCFLNTSPEFAMKRLLAAGSGDIYQLAHVFRGEEQGRRHLPEFMMLEWYREQMTHEDLIKEVDALVRELVPQRKALPLVISAYDVLFREHVGFDPLIVGDADLTAAAERVVAGCTQWQLERDGYLDLLFTHLIEPQLGKDCWQFVVDYPPSQAALARIITRKDGQVVAARFELYAESLELCNGYWELSDADEQRARFIADNAERKAKGLAEMPIDEALLHALDQGLPDCAGVALGVDRLLMLALEAKEIQSVQLLD
ncbi:EF-P lysine aminoacylase GenX [Suttonella sp. R2A3]|uniref:EF-P lysine aminoacylase EpmA n=1 Tax=Suttonella sp. R2A3 TaxID=2908648 RepID=UPI001EEDF6E1|nr:EF-P lysine aminoacylase EpmA [Suttonella sp. R2A3]UJF24692.1 EF-P lysine aminoacylase GenX [Suttonella sp. R2A3]